MRMGALCKWTTSLSGFTSLTVGNLAAKHRTVIGLRKAYGILSYVSWFQNAIHLFQRPVFTSESNKNQNPPFLIYIHPARIVKQSAVQAPGFHWLPVIIHHASAVDLMWPVWKVGGRLLHSAGVLCNVGYPSETHFKLESRKISFIHNIRFISPIVLEFCTEHGNDTAVFRA